jgi:hypothetical protein
MFGIVQIVFGCMMSRFQFKIVILIGFIVRLRQIFPFLVIFKVSALKSGSI